ncbi:MAG: EAL domain-containing protein [Butyrivibrio sp.]|jgi:diguanylate cyclase (GGDEF)-like protein|nr:EAL domain-containing protein [Butyrivibrio sp.]
MEQRITGLASKIFEGFAETSDNSYLFICDMEQDYSRWSKDAVEYFDMPGEYMYGAGKIWEERIHPEDRQIFHDSLALVMKNKADFHEAEYRVRNREGQYVVCSSKGKVIYDDQNKRTYFIGIIANHSIGDVYDPITGLFSMKRFLNVLDNYRSSGEKYIVLLIGLQNFLQINNLYGFTFGNSVLTQIGFLLVRYKDKGIIFRMEGAKFAIATTKIGLKEAISLYHDIQKLLKYSLEVENVKISLDTGCGIAVVDDFNADTQAIYTCVRYALDKSKKQRYGEPVILQNDYLHDNRTTIEKINRIRNSVATGCREFYLCYQPVMSAATGKMSGMEALLRWKGEPYGNVPPNDFIPWLEEDPLFYDLGKWILWQALTEGKQILQKYPDFQMHVNLAYAQLDREEFCTDLLSMLAETGFPAENLCLELTERCRLLKMDYLSKELIFLKAHGIRIALDDFGIGFSSLNLLRILPVDCIKVDRSFVENIENDITYQYLVKAITDCAHNLQICVCVEGIEDARLCDFISTNFYVSTLQGYFYSKPVPMEEYIRLPVYTETR